jgi:hypothetical protein
MFALHRVNQGDTGVKATIESTEQMVMVNGVVPARVWEGRTEGGVPFFALITRVAVHKDADCSQFSRELEEHGPARPEALVVFPARMVL